MKKKAKQIFKQNKLILSNFGYLGVLHVVRMLIPLITYPYLIRVLGKGNYGTIILAQTIISYLVILINFGFNISATKDVSIYKDNKEKLNEIVSSILIIKGVLFLLSFGIILCFLYFSSLTEQQEALFLICMWMCFYEFIFPIWYFQGIEKMGYITFLTLGTRIFFLILIFIFVKTESHLLRVPFINGLGGCIAGFYSIYILFWRHGIKFRIVSLKKIATYIKESYTLFLNNVIMALKDKTNLLLIGFFLGNGAVAEFDLAIKIKDLLFIPINLINQATYPKISREKNMKYMIKVLKISVLGLTLVTILIFPFIDEIVGFLGGQNLYRATYLTQIILFSVPFVAISFTLSSNCINALGYYKLLLRSMTFSTISYFLIILLGYWQNWIIELEFYAYVIVIVYMIELSIRVFYVKKYKMLS